MFLLSLHYGRRPAAIVEHSAFNFQGQIGSLLQQLKDFVFFKGVSP